METMTYDEMKQVQGGDYACAFAAVGFAATDIGLAMAIPTGGWGLVVASIGMAASVYGLMAGCAG